MCVLRYTLFAINEPLMCEPGFLVAMCVFALVPYSWFWGYREEDQSFSGSAE